MHKGGRYRFFTVLLVLVVDLVSINVLYYVLRQLMGLHPSSQIYTIKEFWANLGSDQVYSILQLWINLGYLLSIALTRIDIDIRRLTLRHIIRNVLHRCFVMATVSIVCLFAAKTSAEVSRLFLFFYFSLQALMLLVLHVAMRGVLDLATDKHWYKERAIILGAGSMGQRVYEELQSNPFIGINVLGFFDDDVELQGQPHVLGSLNNVSDYVDSSRVHHIYCTLPLSAKDKIVELMNFAENHVVQFHIIPTVRQYSEAPLILRSIGNIPVLSIREVPLSYAHKALFKRALDILISFIFLITLFPIIYLVLAIIIKRTSPGPVLFVQERTGEGGRNFKCYKFRSMRLSDDANIKQATSNDPRKTRIGDFMRRTNLDELPQFINVLKGDMSIVGPRPHMLLHTSEYGRIVDKYMVRHFIKPGITGWAQVNGCRGETKQVEQMEDRIKKDIWYIENWSIYLDLEIILRTITSTVSGDKQAY